MLEYCKEKWAKNEDKLRKVISESEDHMLWRYEDLIKMVVEIILNKGSESGSHYVWSTDIQEIDDGDYQGSLLYIIHRDCYQPDKSDYLITAVEYGSCSYCDTLQRIQSLHYGVCPTDEQTKEYMDLCRDMVVSMKHPFNGYLDMREAEF